MASLRIPGGATDHLTQALNLARQGGYRLLEGQALTVLAAAQLGRGDAALALDLAERALRVHTETGHRLGQAQAHLVAGRAARGMTGHESVAETHQDAACALFAEIGADLATHAAILVGELPSG